MKLLEKVYSKQDKVVKYVFKCRDQIVEFSYIDNGTGKDIICVPSHTMCNLGCKFCHTTDYIGKIPVYSLNSQEIYRGVDYIYDDLKLNKDTLLISYMGCGEPLNSLYDDTIIMSMRSIYDCFKDLYKTVRFGMSTCLPENNIDRFIKFCQGVHKYNLMVKLHLSLHFTDNIIRKEWMPTSLDIKSSLALCKFYKEYTGNNVEIHYTLIDEINDSLGDIIRLNNLLCNTDFNIKFITYNEKETLNNKMSNRLVIFKNSMNNIPSEVYTPPGRDIGSSCGMFLLNTYSKFIEA